MKCRFRVQNFLYFCLTGDAVWAGQFKKLLRQQIFPIPDCMKSMINVMNPLSKNRAKQIKALKKRSERYEKGLFLIEGLRSVMQVIQNDILEIQYLIFDENTKRNGHPDDEARNLLRSEVPDHKLLTAGSGLFKELCDTENTQGVMAVAKMPDPVHISDLLEKKGVLLAVDRVQDPGNLGTMIRSAVWFGAAGLVLAPGTVDQFHPKVVRGTTGATGVLPWLESDLVDFFDAALQKGWKVHILDGGKDARSWKQVSPGGMDIIAASNEAGGVSPEVSAYADREQGCGKVRIDAHGRSDAGAQNIKAPGVESLNVAVATGILLSKLAGECA